jgi:hypothetical protein
MKILATCLGLTGLLLLSACSSAPPATLAKEIQSERTKDLVISLLSEKGELAMGQNLFTVAFKSAANNQPVDVGTVTVGSSMAMPGMAPMTAPIELAPAGTTGQYGAKGEFSMSGAWKFEVRWDGPAGKGSVTFNTNVR